MLNFQGCQIHLQASISFPNDIQISNHLLVVMVFHQYSWIVVLVLMKRVILVTHRVQCINLKNISYFLIFLFFFVFFYFCFHFAFSPLPFKALLSINWVSSQFYQIKRLRLIIISMKNQIVINKKSTPLTLLVQDKKPIYNYNPYNDLPNAPIHPPVLKSPASKLVKVGDKIEKKIELAKSPSTKSNKMVSPEPVRLVGISAGSNNDSLQKVKIGLAEQGKKVIKTNVKNQKFNDYFDLEHPGAKKMVNLSKKSEESNNSIKSVQSETKKFVPSNKDSKNAKKPIVKPALLITKTVQTTAQSKPQPASIMNIINNIPLQKGNKSGDDRKSWSHTNLNAPGKMPTKQIDLNKSPFFNMDTKNNRNTAGNPEMKKGYSPITDPKNNISNQKNLSNLSNDKNNSKSSVTKKQGKFVPSSSKSQNSQSPKKPLENKMGTPKNDSHFSIQKKMIGIANSNTYQTYGQYLEIGQVITLRVLSTSNIKTATFKVIKLVSKDVKTNLYLVRQKITGFLYCLKKCQVVLPGKNYQQDAVLNKIQYLIREGKIGSYVNHPNLIKTYCTLYDRNHIYQLLEYIEGSNLYERNKNEFYPTKSTKQTDSIIDKSSQSTIINKIFNIKQILLQLLEALSYLHSHGIVHRDIKPANILITHDNDYKIGDFGTAIWQLSAEPIGTLDYAAPEIMAKDKYDYSVDIWALGCVAFELYVGYPPFFNQNRNTTIKKIMECDYQKSSIHDEMIAQFIGRMLQKKPEKRITAKQALNHPFLSDFQKNQEL